MSLPEIVFIHYTMMDSKGRLLGSSKEALSFIIGQQQVFKSIEAASRGMEVGDTRRVAVIAEEAFGLYDPHLNPKGEDKNHPLAGIDILFDIQIVKRRSALKAEILEASGSH